VLECRGEFHLLGVGWAQLFCPWQQHKLWSKGKVDVRKIAGDGEEVLVLNEEVVS